MKYVMKNIESFPPLKAIELANKKLPEIWAAIEKARADMLSTGHNPWREDIYIPACQIYENILLNDPYHVPMEASPRELAVTLSMLASWRQYKEVYRFAPEMEDLLYKQADLNLPLDVLRNLPFPCFYIETPQILGDRYHGFFVAYDQVKDGTPLLRCMAVKKEDTLNFNFSEIRLEKGINLSNGITGAVTKAATEAGITFLKGDPNIETIIYIKYWREILSKLCQLLLYITAENADLKELPGKGHGRTAGRIIKDKYREIRNWDVGYRVVNKLKKAKIVSEDNSVQYDYNMDRSTASQRRMSPKPHWRGGHWHLFWTGKRKSENRKFIIKWIPPTPINCRSEEDMPVTVNQVPLKAAPQNRAD